MADTGESSDDTEREFDDFEPCDEKELEILYIELLHEHSRLQVQLEKPHTQRL